MPGKTNILIAGGGRALPKSALSGGHGEDKAMLFVVSNRETLVSHLPKGAIGAEIGVAQGDFAAHLLKVAQPSRLHLIDPWSHHEAPRLDGGSFLSQIGANPDRPVPPNAPGDQQFAETRARFAGDARVELHRQYSYRAAPGFADRYFDFVYIDGNHEYEYVLRDLIDYAAKVKEDGLILGHDFFENSFAAENNYGIIGAVNAFLMRSRYHFLALTWEPFSTFVLAKRIEGFAAEFLSNCLESDMGVIELPAHAAFNYLDKHHTRKDGSARRVPSFDR